MTIKQKNLNEQRVKIFKVLTEMNRIEIVHYLLHAKYGRKL